MGTNPDLPCVYELPEESDPTDVFKRLAHRGHVLFLDSARASANLGRYSFLTADPFAVVSIATDEGEGLRRLTIENCDELVKIPMQGHVESLNVSVASGICLFEYRRKQAVMDAT